ncbi:MAG: type II toxin-antitoxin system RelE/ParE family toxin [Proteobacteria bacterium]|nr:type II toxin-antitoxin system RelE/ParE family toxin [Pseudomonadota bacterium]
MSAKFTVLKSAGRRIDEIYNYTYRQWGETQAKAYITGLFECFEQIAAHKVAWRLIPAEYEVQGYQTRYQKHVVYWRALSDGSIGIAAILHERMNFGDRLKEDISDENAGNESNIC